MRVFAFSLVLMLAPSLASAEVWHFRKPFLEALVKHVPNILNSQDKSTGRFGTGIWIVTDQNAMYPLAAAWATKIEGVENPYYHNDEVLEAIMSAGDALIADMKPDGQWEFRKKDGSTWGDTYMPWIYSRWIRSYALIRDAMPADRRAKWDKALQLGIQGIYEKHLTAPMQNIPAHNAMGVYLASKLFNRDDWRECAVDYLRRCAKDQHPDGWWTEHAGPVVVYNVVYVDLLGCYYGMSKDAEVLPVLERAARFHAAMTYPDGRMVETVDERNGYHEAVLAPNIGFSFSPEGRRFAKRQLDLLAKERDNPVGPEVAASYLLYGEEGELAPEPKSGDVFISGDKQVMTRRDTPWFVCMTSYTSPISTKRWIQDRQNFFSLYRDGQHLILGGGNTKLQPLWSTFTVGDTALLYHKGDEKPKFTPPAGIIHVPTAAKLDPSKNAIELTYGDIKCSATIDTSNPKQAKIVYELLTPTDQRVEAHVPFLVELNHKWTTASGRSGEIADKAEINLAAGEAGEWLAHRGVRISFPKSASVKYPVLPHNPYTKDGHAQPREGRLVVTLPFSREQMRHEIVVTSEGEEKDQK